MLFRSLGIKALGGLRAARLVTPHMQANGWGRIIFYSGTNARMTGSTSGSIRNSAVIAMTKNLANELGQFGINVSAVNPGLVRTERTADRAQRMGMTEEAFAKQMGDENAIRRMVTADEVAWVVAFLCSPKAVSMTGEQVTVSEIGRAHV